MKIKSKKPGKDNKNGLEAGAKKFKDRLYEGSSIKELKERAVAYAAKLRLFSGSLAIVSKIQLDEAFDQFPPEKYWRHKTGMKYIELKSPVRVQTQIVIEQAKAGLFEEALRTVKNIIIPWLPPELQWYSQENQSQTIVSITLENMKGEAASFVAMEQAKAGLFKEALDTARNIKVSVFRPGTYCKNENYRAKAEAFIAMEQAKAGLFEEALHTIHEMLLRGNSSYPDMKEILTRYRAEAKEFIAMEQAKAGLFEEALHTALQSSSKCKELPALVISGLLQIKEQEGGGTSGQALSTISEIDESNPAKDKPSVGKEQAKAGSKEDATKTFDQALSELIWKTSYDLYHLWKKNASALFKAGLFGDALHNVLSIEYRCNLFEMVVEMEKKGHFDYKFRETVDNYIKNFYDKRLECIMLIAKEQVEAGLKEDAIKTFDQALCSLSQMKKLMSDGDHNVLYINDKQVSIAIELIKAGFIEKGIEILNQPLLYESTYEQAITQSIAASEIMVKPLTREEKDSLAIMVPGDPDLSETLEEIDRLREVEEIIFPGNKEDSG
jgi:hypothetical protein